MEPGHWDKAPKPEEDKEDAPENKVKIYQQKLLQNEDFGFDLKAETVKVAGKTTV